jgi:DNA-binding MarR family transcriptional regulator
VEKLLKGILDKLFQSNQKTTQSEVKPISHAEVEALVNARLKEHAATLEKSIANQAADQEDYSLTPKQIEFALSLIDKMKNEFELATNTANLTVKDLNKLIAYNRYKNKGILINLVKKGVLRRYSNSSK